MVHAFAQAEAEYLEVSESGGDRSGSCALMALVVGEECLIGNVGDSRAILSSEGGTCIRTLSTDHKPCEPGEYARILKAGGTVYR